MKKTSVFLTALLVVAMLSACSAQNGLTSGALLLQAARAKNGGTVQTVDATVTPDTTPDTISETTPTTPETTPEATTHDTPAATDKKETTEKTSFISRDKAIELALKAAGVNRADACGIEAKLDRERAITVWEVEFDTRTYEYSYDINASDGSIIKSEREFND